jgi:hypothetical protein
MTDTPGGDFSPGPPDPGPMHTPGPSEAGGGWSPGGAHIDPTTGAPVPGYPHGPNAMPPPYVYDPTPTATPGILRRAPQRNDSVAMSAFTCSLIGVPLIFCFCLGVPLCMAGVLMGFFAQKRIRDSEGALGGSSMATLAIVIGAAGLALFVLLLLSTWGRDLRRF